MNKSRNKNAAKINSMINIVIVIVIAAFVAAGGYATYNKISGSLEEKAISSGEKEETVEYMANDAGMSIEDFLAQYNLSLNDTITKKTTKTELGDNMTIENYLLYTGDETPADDVIAAAGLSDTVTKDTLWKDFRDQAPVSYFAGSEDVFNQIKEQYGLGDEVTYDMPYGEFNKILEEKQAELTAAAEDAQENTESETAETENTAEEDTTEEAPAAE